MRGVPANVTSVTRAASARVTPACSSPARNAPTPYSARLPLTAPSVTTTASQTTFWTSAGMITSSGRSLAWEAIVSEPIAPSGIVAITNTDMIRACVPLISANATTTPMSPSTTPMIS